MIQRNAKSSYDEYKYLGHDLTKYYIPLGDPSYTEKHELIKSSWTLQHSEYLRFLVSSFPSVLLQPVRMNYYLDLAAALIPDGKFVWILRSVEGVVSSLLRRRSDLFLDKISFRTFQMIEERRIPAFRTSPLQHVLQHGQYALERFAFSARVRSNKHLIRDPWSQGSAAEYIIRTRKHYKQFWNRPLWFKLMLTWYDLVDVVETFRRSSKQDRFAVVRYEDLCERPNEIVQELCNWIGIDPPQADLRSLISSKPTCVFCPDDARWQEAKDAITRTRRSIGCNWDPPQTTRIPCIGKNNPRVGTA